MEENKRVCDICGCVIEEDAGTTVGERLLCEECVSTHCTTCDHCGEIIWITDAEHDENTTLCRSCYEDSYRQCEGCGRLIHDSEINWRGDYPYCDTCYDEFDDEIEDYSYKPEPVFYGDGNRYLGVEL